MFVLSNVTKVSAHGACLSTLAVALFNYYYFETLVAGFHVLF